MYWTASRHPCVYDGKFLFWKESCGVGIMPTGIHGMDSSGKSPFRRKIPTSKMHVILLYIFQGVGGNLEAVLAGRFFVGLSLGMEGSIHSMYICEIVSKRYRGPMVASGVVVINFGFLLVYILGSFTHWQVRIGSVRVDFL